MCEVIMLKGKKLSHLDAAKLQTARKVTDEFGPRKKRLLSGMKEILIARNELALKFIDGKASNEELTKKLGNWYTKNDIQAIIDYKESIPRIVQQREKRQADRILRNQTSNATLNGQRTIFESILKSAIPSWQAELKPLGK